MSDVNAIPFKFKIFARDIRREKRLTDKEISLADYITERAEQETEIRRSRFYKIENVDNPTFFGIEVCVWVLKRGVYEDGLHQ